MSDIQWEDDVPAGTSKYPAMLKDIKRAQLDDPALRGKWAFLNEFAGEATARDLAYRLGNSHDEFDFVSRKRLDGTAVYCRLKEGINV